MMCSNRKLSENSLDYIIPDFATSSETNNVNYLSNKNNRISYKSKEYLFYCCSCLRNKDTLRKLYLRNTANRSRKTRFVILFLIALCPLILQTAQAAPMLTITHANSQLHQQKQEVDIRKVLEPAYNNSHRIADIFKKAFIDNKTINHEMKIWGKWLQKDLEKITPHIQAIKEISKQSKPNSKEVYVILNHLTIMVNYLLSAYDKVLKDFKDQTDFKNSNLYKNLSNLRSKVKETQSYLHPVIQIMESTYNFKKPNNFISNDIQMVEDMPIMRFLNLHYNINKIILDIFKTKLGFSSGSRL